MRPSAVLPSKVAPSIARALSTSRPLDFRQRDAPRRAPADAPRGAFAGHLKVAESVVDAALDGDSWAWKRSPDARYTARRGVSGQRFPGLNLPPSPRQARRAGKVAESEQDEAPLLPWEEPFQETELEPGHFVEARRNETVTHGLLIRLDVTNGRPSAWLINNLGDITFVSVSDVLFSFPLVPPSQVHGDLLKAVDDLRLAPDLSVSFAASSADLYDPESDPYLHTKLAQAQPLRALGIAREDALRRVTKLAGEKGLYERVRARDEREWGETTIGDVARFLTGEEMPDAMTMLATLDYLLGHPAEYVAGEAATFRTTGSIRVRPQRDVVVLETVADWLGRDAVEFKSFALKAQALMDISRTRSSTPTSDLPAPLHAPRELRFTSTDRTILTLLVDSLRPTRNITRDPYQALASIVLKRVDPHADINLTFRAGVFAFLQDIGVFAPWETLIPLSVDLHLSRDSEYTESNLLGARALAASARTTRSASVPTPMGPEDVYLVDPLESQRHDFGSLPVYVIDDASASELDDGISIEPALPDGSVWVHAHIADPTSLLPPTHRLSTMAYERHTTSYFPERIWPMLPHALSTERFSLGAAVRGGKSGVQNSMTFSARVRPDGTWEEYEVRAGLVRNVKVLRYDDVDRALGSPPIVRTSPLLDPPELVAPRPVPGEALDDLERLRSIGEAMMANRVEKGVIQWNTERPTVTVSPKGLALNRSPVTEDHASTFWDGRPIVSITPSTNPFGSPARSTVSSIMVLAGQVAARMCAERGIPAPFRGSSAPLVQSPADLDELLALRNPVTGEVDPVEVVRRKIAFQAGTMGVTPLPHVLAGCPDGYGRVTSPLRRYTDMVFHWQLKAHLLGARLPFSADQLAAELPRWRRLDATSRRAGNMAARYWTARELARRFEADRDDKYSNLELRVASDWGWSASAGAGSVSAMATVPALGGLEVRLQRIDTGKAANARLGETLMGRLNNILLSANPTIEFVEA